MQDWMRLVVRGRKRLERARLRAVDHHASACYPARPAAAEEGDEISHLLRGAEPSVGNLAAHESGDAFAVPFQATLPGPAWMEDAARRDGNHADAAGSELAGLLVGQADQCRLCRVVAHRAAAFAAPDARDVDDHAEVPAGRAVDVLGRGKASFAGGGFEERQGLACGPYGGPEIPIDRGLPPRVVHRRPPGRAAADEGYERVESAQLAACRFHGAGELLRHGRICNEGNGLGRARFAALRRALLQGCAGARNERHRASLVGQRPRRRRSEAAASSDEQGAAPGQPEVHPPTLAPFWGTEADRRRVSWSPAAVRGGSGDRRSRPPDQTSYIPMCGPPAPAPPSFSSFGFSATIASVVSMSEATDEAFCSAVRETLVGSITPAARRSS